MVKKLVNASKTLASVNGTVLRSPYPAMLLNTIALQGIKEFYNDCE